MSAITAKMMQDSWISFLRVLAVDSKLKFVVGPNCPAATDGKTVWLPSLPASLTPDDLSLLKAFGYHEVGHTKVSNIGYYQEFGMIHGGPAQVMLNAVDDVYMERKQCKLSRPAERFFRAKAEILIKRKSFRDGSASPAEAVACYLLTFLHSRVWGEYAPAFKVVRENLEAHFGEYAEDIIEKLNQILVHEFPNVTSTEDAGALVLRIVEMLKQEAEKQANQPDDETKPDEEEGDSPEDGDGESDGEDGDDSADGSGGEGGDSDQAGSDADGSDSGPDQGSDQDAKGQGGDGSQGAQTQGKSASSGKGQKGPSLAEIVEKILNEDGISTDEVFDVRKAIEQLAEEVGNGTNPDYVGEKVVPNFEIDPEQVSNQNTGGAKPSDCIEGMVMCPSDSENAKALKDSLNQRVQVLAMKLQALLMSREEEDVYSSHRGNIGESMLHRLAIGNTKVFERSEPIEKPTPAISVVADLSSSTQGQTAVSIQGALVILEMMLDQMGVEREILGFAPRTKHVLNVVRTFGDSHRTAMERIGGLHNHVGGGWTPIGEAVFAAGTRLMSTKPQRKVLFVLTDGAPSDVRLATEQTLMAQAAGIQVVYLLIGSSVRSDWLADAGIPFACAATAQEICPVLLSQAEELLA